MGTNNRQRRAAKAKSRAKARSQRNRNARDAGRSSSWSTGGPSWSDHEGPTFTDHEGPTFTDHEGPTFTDHEIATYVLTATASGRYISDRLFEVSPLSVLGKIAPKILERAAEGVLLDQVTAIWDGGWQPSELARHGRRKASTAAGGRLIALAIAVDDTNRRANTLDARWRDQVAALELPAVDGKPGWVAQWATDEGLTRDRVILTTLDAVMVATRLHRLEPLLPLPGIDGGPPRPVEMSGGMSGAEADPVLELVRNLLAKAESTTFEAEAAVFTTKAQELITRHAIDVALLAASAGGATGRPVMIRIPIDAPYVDAKTLLLQTVAEASRCRTVFDNVLDLSTLVGFPDDVATTEMLFTSLLVQAQSALTEAARGAAPGTRTRQQSYRSAFLLSYAQRIGDRLAEINQTVVADVEANEGSAFLPVLRARSDAVNDFVDERFGELGSHRVRTGFDAVGWSHGRVAADVARLSSGDLEDDLSGGPEDKRELGERSG